MRFRLVQEDATHSHLAARIWAASDPEPGTWQVEVSDATAALQALSGGIALDSYSSSNPPSPVFDTLVDDLAVVLACGGP